MKCGKCGFENLESAHVCRKCGATLSDEKNLLNEESSSKSNVIIILGLVIVILLVIVGLFAYSYLNQPTEIQTPVIINNTDIKPVNNTEIVYIANGTGSGSNVFSLDAGTYIINISVTPLNTNSYFKLSDLKNHVFTFKGNNSNLTQTISSINFTSNVTSDFTINFKDIKSWNIKVIKIKEVK